MKQIAGRRAIMKKGKKLKNYLDERQEQQLLEVEHRGCWLAFWGLLIALMVQQIMGVETAQMAGEWIVFMVLAAYLVIACARRGIWDRRFKPNTKTNLLFAAGGSVLSGAVMFVTVYHRHPEYIVGSIAAGVFDAGFLFVIIFVSLSILAKLVTDRQKKMDVEPEDDANDLNDPRR